MNLNSGSSSYGDASTSTLSFAHSTKVIIKNKERLKIFLVSTRNSLITKKIYR